MHMFTETALNYSLLLVCLFIPNPSVPKYLGGSPTAVQTWQVATLPSVRAVP